MTSFKSMLEMVPSLNLAQLRELKGRVGALLSLNGESGKSKETIHPAPRSNGSDTSNESDAGDFQLTLEVIRDELKGLGIPTSVYNKSKLSYRSKVEEIWLFLNENIPDLKRIERRALFHTCVRCLIRTLKKQGLPVTETMVLKHLHRLPEALDDGFPGYLESGMLSKVVRRVQHVRKESNHQTVS